MPVNTGRVKLKTHKYLSSEIQLLNAISLAGYTPPNEAIKLDGKIHRFHSGNGKKSDKAGWYYANISSNGPSYGAFGCWASGETIQWREESTIEFSKEQRKKYAIEREQRKIEQAEQEKLKHEKAAVEAQKIWSNSKLAPNNNPYLKRKSVQAHGLRIMGNDTLICPMFDKKGSLSTLEYIFADGTKRRLKEGKAKGAFWWIGEPQNGQPIALAEGFSSAASSFQHSNIPCFISYNAQNIEPTLAHIRCTYPASEVVIVVDNDNPNKQQQFEGGAGLFHAKKAAERHGAYLAIPPQINGNKTDPNDYACAGHNLGALIHNALSEKNKVNSKPLAADSLITLDDGQIITQYDIAQNHHGLNGKKGTLNDLKVKINTGSKDPQKWRIECVENSKSWIIDYTLPTYNASADQPTYAISRHDVGTKMLDLLKRNEQIQIISLPGGAGKTAALPSYINQLPVRQKILIAAPTVRLAQQIHQDLLDQNQSFTVKQDIVLLFGRDRDQHGENSIESGLDPICKRAPLFRKLRVHNIPEQELTSQLCKSPHGQCPHSNSCPYLKQRDDAKHAKVVITTHKMVLSGTIKGDFNHVIIDEQPSLVSISHIKKSDIDALYGDTADAVSQCFYALKIGKQLHKLDQAQELQNSLKSWLQSVSNPVTDLLDNIIPSMNDSDIDSAINFDMEKIAHQVPTRAKIIVRGLIQVLNAKSNKMYVNINHTTKEQFLCCSRLKKINLKNNPKITVLDATPRKSITDQIWPSSHFHKIDITDAIGCNVVQDIGCKFTQSDLEKPGTIGRIAILQQVTNAAIVTQKTAENKLHTLGIPKKKTGHYNALRGLNRFKDENSLIIVGRTLIRPEDAENQARAIWDDIKITGKYELQETTIGGKRVVIESHADPRVASIIAQNRDDELTQTAVRLRTVHGQKGRQLIICGNVPIPGFTPDIVVSNEIVPSFQFGKVAEHFMFQGHSQIIPLSQTLVSNAMNIPLQTVKNWQLPQTTENWFKRSKSLLIYINRDLDLLKFKKSHVKRWSDAFLIKPGTNEVIFNALKVATKFEDLQIKDLPNLAPVSTNASVIWDDESYDIFDSQLSNDVKQDYHDDGHEENKNISNDTEKIHFDFTTTRKQELNLNTIDELANIGVLSTQYNEKIQTRINITLHDRYLMNQKPP